MGKLWPLNVKETVYMRGRFLTFFSALRDWVNQYNTKGHQPTYQ